MDIKPTKIAVLCNYELLPERVGGMDYFFWMFNKKCIENSIEIDWFFSNKSQHGNYYNLKIIESNYDNVEHFFCDYIKNNPQNYTHIITHFVEICSPIFKKIKSFSNAKISAVDHNPRPINGYSFLKIIEKKIKGMLYSRYIDTFIGVSNYSKNQLIKEFGFQLKNKTKVILNGLDYTQFKQKSTFNTNSNFIIACHLRKDKGIQDVILAVKNINLPFTITIYGTGNYEPELKKMIAQFSLNDRFIFKGSVANLQDIYCNYDYLIHPSHGETFCYAVVESLLCNLPVITNNQGNVLGLIINNRNGFLYQDKNIKALENSINNILSNTFKIENGLHKEPKVLDLSLQKMVNNYITLLQ